MVTDTGHMESYQRLAELANQTPDPALADTILDVISGIAKRQRELLEVTTEVIREVTG